MQVRLDDLNGREIAGFLEDHLREMKSVSPPESSHALELEGLKSPEISFWTVWDGDVLVGCGALKEVSPSLGEIKSMRTHPASRRRGIASMLLHHMIEEARDRGYSRLSLETGSMEFFRPARQLYLKFGFNRCGPFSDYVEDPNSIFMTRELD